jgi:rod shape-determining protein MreD
MVRRGLISFAAVAVAVVCQLTIVDRIAFPGGAGPDLVLVLAAALALASGPLVGALIGFWAGLALDVAPPGSHLIGQNALVFCLVGYLCGLLAAEPSGDGVPEQGHTALFEIVVTAVGAICGEGLAALLGVMLSDPRVTWSAITHVLPVAAAYDAVACPFLLYAAAAALRLAGARGQGSRSPGEGWVGSHGPGAASGLARVSFTSRRGDGLLGGSLYGGGQAGAGPARTRMGRSLLGGSVFSRPSPALARTTPPGRTPSLGRALAPRFSRGKALSRLTGALRRSARPRSPGRGWLRRTSPRPGALGGGTMGGTMGGGIRGGGTMGGGTMGRRAFGRRAFGGGFPGRGSAGGTPWRRGGTSALRAGGPARLRMPRRKLAKRNWRTGGYR